MPDTEDTEGVTETNTEDTGPNPTGEEDPDLSDGTVTNPQNVTAEEDEDDEDPLEAYYAARRAAEEKATEEELEARAAALAEKRLREREEQEAARREATQLNDAYTNTVHQLVTNLRSGQFYDEYGDPMTLSDEQIQELVINPLNAMNSRQKETIGTAYTARLADAALSKLSDAARDKFIAEAADKPIDEWLDLFAEMRASDTTFAKKMAEEIALKEKAAEARGYARAAKLPPGTPPTGAERQSNRSKTFDLNTHTGLAGALAAGQISSAEYLEGRKRLMGTA